MAERLGVRARLIQRAAEMDFDWLHGVNILGITAGASAPELLVREVVDRLATRYAVEEQEVESATEAMLFKLPRKLVA